MQDELQRIYKLLKGDNSDRNDGGLCGDVEKNTYWRKRYESREESVDKNTEHRKREQAKQSHLWKAIVGGWIAMAIKIIYDWIR